MAAFGILLHEPFHGGIDAAQGVLKVALLDGDDDVQLARALVDHADVDVGLVERGEDARRGALGIDHALTDDGDEGKIVLDRDDVRLEILADAVEDLLTVS